MADWEPADGLIMPSRLLYEVQVDAAAILQLTTITVIRTNANNF
jgi:hypothetical protein